MVKEAYKIVTTGPYWAGKSTLVRSLCKDSFSIDVDGTTIVMDYGERRYHEVDVALFGTPGQAKFNKMIEIVARDADGILLVIDSAYPKTWPYAITMVKKVIKIENTPCVVCANKQDLAEALSPEVIKENFNALNLVIGTVALTGENVEVALDALMKMV